MCRLYSADKHIPTPDAAVVTSVLVPRGLVNFPGRFITRRPVLSGNRTTSRNHD